MEPLCCTIAVTSKFNVGGGGRGCIIVAAAAVVGTQNDSSTYKGNTKDGQIILLK